MAIGKAFLFNITYATPDYIVNGCFTGPPFTDARGVWFTLLGTGERLSSQSCGSNGGTAAAMSVFTGNCSNLQCGAGTIGLCDGASFFFDTIVGTTYLVLIEAAIRQRFLRECNIDICDFRCSRRRLFGCCNLRELPWRTVQVRRQWETVGGTIL
jgi:hypothetical protein